MHLGDIGILRINRYIMECKSSKIGGAFKAVGELIDTLWNVNTSAAEEPSGDAQGINRYIMECKSGRGEIYQSLCQELIDTLWNVNKSVVREYRKVTRINRYIMECKYTDGDKTYDGSGSN